MIGNPYTLLNAKVSIGPSSGHWDLALWGTNLLNDTYKSFVADLSGSGGFYETFYGAPLQFGVQATARF
jgi:iron complex outermembrane recepter protein